jgi:hypothetical protein
LPTPYIEHLVRHSEEIHQQEIGINYGKKEWEEIEGPME